MNGKLIVDGMDITDFVKSVQWSGNMDQPARSLNADMIWDALPEPGDSVQWEAEGETLFTGVILYVDAEPYGCSFEAMDQGVYLANNNTFKEYKGTPETITRQLCAEFGIKAGRLAPGGEGTKVTSTGDLSAFAVIDRAYEGTEKKARRRYVIRVEGDTLSVTEAGGEPVAVLENTLSSAQRSWSIRNMVNRVVTLNSKGKQKGDVEDAESRRLYGTFQRTLKEERGKSVAEEAQKLLQGVEQTGSVTALGNPLCISGRTVQVREPRTGLTGTYLIRTDSHTWDASGYQMRLEFYDEEQ